MAVNKNLPPYKRYTKEDMDREVEFMSFYDEGEEFPLEEINKTLKELNITDSTEYHYDRSRDAEQ